MVISVKSTPSTNPSGAIIGYNNLLTSADTSDGSKALTNNTYERWRPSSGAVTMKFQLSSVSSVNYIAIASHNLTGESITLQTAATTGGALTDRASATPTDNKPLMFTFDSVSVEEVAFVCTFSAANEIGNIFAGSYLQMPQPIYGSHKPLADKTTYLSNNSETGQFLGRTIIKKGQKTSYSWQHLEPDFVRGDFNTFKESAKTKPFFIKWRPDYYPNDVGFCYSESDINIDNMGGGHRLMSASMSVSGHSDV